MQAFFVQLAIMKRKHSWRALFAKFTPRLSACYNYQLFNINYQGTRRLSISTAAGTAECCTGRCISEKSG